MDLSGPKRLAWWVALFVWIGVFVGILAILGSLFTISFVSANAFWILAIGWLLLAVAAAVIYLRLLR